MVEQWFALSVGHHLFMALGDFIHRLKRTQNFFTSRAVLPELWNSSAQVWIVRCASMLRSSVPWQELGQFHEAGTNSGGCVLWFRLQDSEFRIQGVGFGV